MARKKKPRKAAPLTPMWGVVRQGARIVEVGDASVLWIDGWYAYPENAYRAAKAADRLDRPFRHEVVMVLQSSSPKRGR